MMREGSDLRPVSVGWRLGFSSASDREAFGVAAALRFSSRYDLHKRDSLGAYEKLSFRPSNRQDPDDAQCAIVSH